jgi:uncharacterized protein (DUF433 family)
MDAYPEIEGEDIRQCIEYVAWLSSERNVRFLVYAFLGL